MARDPLQVLHRLRGIAMDAARRALADRLGEEDAATARSAALDAEIGQEIRRQQTLPVAPADAFAAWIRCAKQEQMAARGAARASAAASNAARESVTEARAGKRALEAALKMAKQARRLRAAREEQGALDEAGARTGQRRSRWSG